MIANINMNRRYPHQWCFVPGCTNTAINSPDKIFISVPDNIQRKKKWFKAAKRELKDVSIKTHFYCCEDHFRLEEDMENFIEYKLSKVAARMKPGIVPHIFHCQSKKKSHSCPSSKKRAKKRNISEIVLPTRPAVPQISENIVNSEPSTSCPLTEDIKENSIKKSVTQVRTENEMAAVEQTVKIEAEEVKEETTEINDGSFGVEQITWGLAIKDENTDGIGLDSIKNEHSFVDAWSNEEVLEMPGGKIKVEEDLDYKQFEPIYITEEGIIKKEEDCDGFTDGNTEIVLNSALKRKITERQHHTVCKKASRGSYSCYNCDYTALHKQCLIEHIQKRCNPTFASKRNFDNPSIEKHQDFSEIQECTHCIYKTTCVHCNETFKNYKYLDEHTIRKHPDFIASVSRKIHECTYCTYKTTLKYKFDTHMLAHTESAESYELNICIHCDAKFKSKTSLDDHTIREHPDFIASVSSKIHECTHCTYKTTLLTSFARHMLQHPESEVTYKPIICIHCNATFKSKASLGDHIIRKHPDFEASVSSKLHECSHCTYKTTLKCNFDRHMLKHHDTVGSCKVNMCIHCDATFSSPIYLDEHTIRNHPDLIVCVSRKIHECTYCTYKTTLKYKFAKHLLKHPETVDSCKLSTCIHCNATFKSKASLDDHTLREHPDFISSVSSKIHECTHCTYKTTLPTNFARHMLQHPETADTYKLSTCVHCNATFKSKAALDDHTVRQHPDFKASVYVQIHECTYCTYITTLPTNFAKHMLQHPETAGTYKFSICNHCDATFKSRAALDDHTIREHPDFKASVSSKLHKCTHCTYITTMKSSFDRHMLKHLDSVDSCEVSMCVHCDAKFKNKQDLDEHTIRYHPDFIESVSRKIHECTYCTYKTTLKYKFNKHLLKHPETVDICKLSICIHCNARFNRKVTLDDHTIRKHPDFIASVSSKLHECTHCTYKTTLKSSLSRHMLKHPETIDSCKLSICIHCNARFNRKDALDDHTIRKHPDFIASVSSKLHECTHCTYKTTLKSSLSRHMLKHPETIDSCKLNKCIHCDAGFINKHDLDEHTVRKHPDTVASISKKIHECTHCSYKTNIKRYLARHMLIHLKTTQP